MDTHMVRSTPRSQFYTPGLENLGERLQDKKLGLQESGGNFQPCPVSLSPWRLPRGTFMQAQAVASAVSLTFVRASKNPDFLKTCLSDFTDQSALLFHLKQVLQNRSSVEARNFNLSRQDFLLDTQLQWRLVESNSIAAGMGPLSEKLGEFQQEIAANSIEHPADNGAITRQARALYKAAMNNNGCIKPLILFAVEADEDNVHDQSMLCLELRRLGARISYKTLRQMKQQLFSQGKQLYLGQPSSPTLVDLIYYRTGYNLQDYNDNKGNTLELLNHRSWIENHKVTVCPSIHYQIATSKWVQMKLSTMGKQALQTQFSLESQLAGRVARALDTQFEIPNGEHHIRSRLKTGRWLLKSQNEGGGNVLDERASHQQLAELGHQSILMEKISTAPRSEPVAVLANNNITEHTNIVSELGIFTLGEEHHYGGYLLRSKPQQQLESGVHRGGGFLDNIEH